MVDASKEDAASKPQFEAVTREPTLANKVADLLLNTILTQKLRPGDRLPSERDLGEQFGVSRTVVREAVRSLAAKGVIEVRSGSGLHVASVDAKAVTESMKLFLHGRDPIDYDQVHEVRAMLEVQIAGVACERATGDDLDELAKVYERMEEMAHDPEQVALADVEFHRTIAKITHNELYLIMLDSIGDLLLEVRRATLRSTPGRPQIALRYHRTILDRIRDHDQEGAHAAMRAHLEDSLTDFHTITSPNLSHSQI